MFSIYNFFKNQKTGGIIWNHFLEFYCVYIICLSSLSILHVCILPPFACPLKITYKHLYS